MNTGVTIRLSGHLPEAVAKILARRLVELGHKAEYAETVVRLVTPEPGPDLPVRISEHDTADFAAEKVLDLLAERGAVDLEPVDYSPEEEARIRARLSDLGYIE